MPLRTQTLRLTLQRPPISKIHHYAIGHFLPLEVRSERRSELVEMEFLDHAAG
jgi:hypothetical protein